MNQLHNQTLRSNLVEQVHAILVSCNEIVKSTMDDSMPAVRKGLNLLRRQISRINILLPKDLRHLGKFRVPEELGKVDVVRAALQQLISQDVSECYSQMYKKVVEESLARVTQYLSAVKEHNMYLTEHEFTYHVCNLWEEWFLLGVTSPEIQQLIVTDTDGGTSLHDKMDEFYQVVTDAWGITIAGILLSLLGLTRFSKGMVLSYVLRIYEKTRAVQGLLTLVDELQSFIGGNV